MRTIKPMLALALALAGGGTFAQSVQVADSAFQRFLINTTGVGQQTVGFTGSGQPVPQVSGHTLAPDGGPGVRASATGILRNQAGGQIPVALAGRVTPAVVARFIGRAIPLLGAAVIASDIADFAAEQGFQIGFSDGAVTVAKPDPSCPSAPCTLYRVNNATWGAGSPFYTSRLEACRYAANRWSSLNGNTPAVPFIRTSDNACFVTSPEGAVYVGPLAYSTQVSQTPVSTPSSVGEFEQFLLQGNPFPVTSSVAEAIMEARELLGEPIPLAQPQVTGPSSSPGSTSTTAKPDGSTVTITQTYNHTYTGPTINTTTTTVTSTIPAGGGPVQTETTVQTPDPVQQDPEPFVMPCGVPGSPPCAVKVDETGVPTQVSELADTQDLADQSISPIDGVEDPSFWPSLPDVTFDFALPTACSPLSVPAFSPDLAPVFPDPFYSQRNAEPLMGERRAWAA